MAIPVELRQELESRLDQVLAFNPPDLVREQRDFNFTPIKEVITWFLERAQQMKGNIDNVSQWPTPEVSDYIAIWGRVLESLTAIKSFDPTAISNPTEQRTSLITALQNLYDNHYRKFHTDLTLAQRKTSDADDALNRILSDAQKKKSELESIAREADGTVKAIQDASAIAGTSAFSTIFSQDSKAYGRKAMLWQIAGVLVLAGTIALGLYLLDDIDTLIRNIPSDSSSLQILIAKLVLVSFAAYAIRWVSRNYYASRHLQAVNKHRQNSLGVFQAISGATDDPNTKNLILLQAAKTIFDSGDSGYLSRGSDGGQSDRLSIDQFFPGRKE